MNKVPMTIGGFGALKEELRWRQQEERPRIIEAISEARSHGDLSENAEYHAAKEEQEKIENRIMMLEYQLSKAQIVEDDEIDTSTASLGTTVTLKDTDLKKTFVYKLVGTEEADIKENRISAASPVGMAVMGKKAGEEVIVRTPRGIRHIKVMKIQLK